MKKTIVHKLHAQQKHRRKCHILEVIKESAVSLLAVGMPSMPSSTTPDLPADVISVTDEGVIEANVMARTTILGLKRTKTISGSSINNGSICGRTVNNSFCNSTLSPRSVDSMWRHNCHLSRSKSADIRNTLSENCVRIPDITTAEVHTTNGKYASTSESVEEQEEPENLSEEADINRCLRPRLHNVPNVPLIDYHKRLLLDSKGKKLASRSRSAAAAEEVGGDDLYDYMVDINTSDEVWNDSMESSSTSLFVSNDKSNYLLKLATQSIDIRSTKHTQERDAEDMRQSFKQNKVAVRQPTVEVSCL